MITYFCKPKLKVGTEWVQVRHARFTFSLLQRTPVSLTKRLLCNLMLRRAGMRQEGESGARQGLLLSSVNWLLDKANLRYRVNKMLG